MARPSGVDGRHTRQAILSAALDLFADKGYFGTSLRDIASAVGVRGSALYNYFRSKEDLFSALLATASESRDEQLASLLAVPLIDVRSVLERLTAFLLDHFSEPRQQRLFRVLMSDGMRLAKDGRLDLIGRLTSASTPLRELMQHLVADGRLHQRDPELLVMQFLGPLVLWRYCHALRPNEPVVDNREAFVRDHVDQFLLGAGVLPITVGLSVSQGTQRDPVDRRATRASKGRKNVRTLRDPHVEVQAVRLQAEG